jgi:hypothetical protein
MQMSDQFHVPILGGARLDSIVLLPSIKKLFHKVTIPSTIDVQKVSKKVRSTGQETHYKMEYAH